MCCTEKTVGLTESFPDTKTPETSTPSPQHTAKELPAAGPLPRPRNGDLVCNGHGSGALPSDRNAHEGWRACVEVGVIRREGEGVA